MDFEKKLEKLEKIVEAMEAGELTLDQSLKKFEEGVKLSKECQKELTQAELKVKKLMGLDENGEPITEDMEVEE